MFSSFQVVYPVAMESDFSVIAPSLLSHCSFSFVFGCEISFLVGFSVFLLVLVQQLIDFGALIRSECTSFYSAILNQSRYTLKKKITLQIGLEGGKSLLGSSLTAFKEHLLSTGQNCPVKA